MPNDVYLLEIMSTLLHLPLTGN